MFGVDLIQTVLHPAVVRLVFLFLSAALEFPADSSHKHTSLSQEQEKFRGEEQTPSFLVFWNQPWTLTKPLEHKTATPSLQQAPAHNHIEGVICTR